MNFRTFVKRSALVMSISLASASTAAAIDYTWVGGNSNLADPANWNPNADPHLGAQTNNAFFDANGTSNINFAGTDWWVRQMIFNANAQAYTINATDPAAYISLNGVSNLPVAPGNIALQNNSSQQQVINMIGVGKLGITGIIDTGTAVGGSFVINAPLSVGDGGTNAHYTELTGSNNIYFNVDSSINAAGTTAGGA